MFKRFVRSALATAVGIAAAKYQNNELFISLTPILMAGAKAIRQKYPNSTFSEWMPF